MAEIISFPQKKPLSLEEEFDLAWEDMRLELKKLFISAGFHIDYAEEKTIAIAREAKALRLGLISAGVNDFSRINLEVNRFILAEGRRALGLSEARS